MIFPREFSLVLLLTVFLSQLEWAFAENKNVQYQSPRNSEVSKGQKITLSFFATTSFILLGYVIWLRSELARITVRRIINGLSAPLLSEAPIAEDQSSTVTPDVELPNTP
uniref:Uncharacterized protein n=1 Tax=Odontella aurita TaxID=265563 RepID=A0A7S4NCY7_9STRA